MEGRERELSLTEKLLEGIPINDLENWLREKRGNLLNKRVVEGLFEVGEIEGSNTERNITLAILKKDGEYPQHVHHQSDAVLIVTNGEGFFLSGQDKILVKPGEVIEVPRNMPHGFMLEEGKELEFLSVQSPPIRNPETGEEDLHNIDLKDIV